MIIYNLFFKKMVKTAESTKLERGKILGLRVSGKSIREISKMLKIPKSTVQYTIVRCSDFDDMRSVPTSGRPKSLNKENWKKGDSKFLMKSYVRSLRACQKKLKHAFLTIDGQPNIDFSFFNFSI